METRDLERIRFVTRHFHDLQGLRSWVPLGLIALGLGGILRFANRPMGLLLALLLPGAFLLAARARRYYRDSFGEVEPQRFDPAEDAGSLSIYGPAGWTARVAGISPVPPLARRFLAAAALAATLFSILQAIPPGFVVEGEESRGQPPRIAPQPSGALEPSWIVGSRHPRPSYTRFDPPWIEWLYIGTRPTRPPSTLRAVLGQMLYALCGSVFLCVWLWRGRRRSQSHHLAFAVLLLGLAALGTTLGFAVDSAGEIPPVLDLLLPALVYPGVALLLCGSAMVLAGLLDHWQLVQVLGRPSMEEPS